MPRFRASLALYAFSATALPVPLQGQPAARPAVRGIVFDSTAMRPLAGARVQLVALPVREGPLTVGTDSAGGFRFDSLALGTYLLGFSHPRLDSLGVEPSLARIDLRTSGTIVATLATPSAGTLIRSTCQADLRTDSTGVLRGFARSARDGFPIPGARLRLEWPEFVLARGGMQRATRAIDAQASEVGAFLICGVPVGTTVLAHAFAASDSSGVVEILVPESGLLRRDLWLGTSPSAAVAASPPPGDSLAPSPAATAQPSPAAPRVRGTVRSSDGAVVGGARIRLINGGAETLAADDGSFVLTGVAPGSRMLDVRALGFLPATLAVDVMASGDVDVAVVLASAETTAGLGITALDTLRVQGEDRLASTAIAVRKGFRQRMQLGVGVFLTDSLIHAKARHLPSELFRGMPGLTVTNGSGGQGVYMRESATFNATKGLCLPTIVVDGARAPRAPVDQMAVVSDMRAVEVYARGELAPSQYQTSDGCGVIVIWTRTMWDASRPVAPRR